MSKGIIIVDEIPKCCGRCPYAEQLYGLRYTCAVSSDGGLRRLLSHMAGRPDWCPILPVGKDLEERLEQIDRFFDSVSTEELEPLTEEEMPGGEEKLSRKGEKQR